MRHRRPGVGTQTLVPLNFSAVVAPLIGIILTDFILELWTSSFVVFM